MGVYKPPKPPPYSSKGSDDKFDSDKRRPRERFRKQYKTQQKIAKQKAAKRASAAKKGAEGPKRSQPGGYAASYAKQPPSRGKKRT